MHPLPTPFFLLALALSADDPVTFSAMGCGPYNAGAEKALAAYVPRENAKPSVAFMVHLGDVVSGDFGRKAVDRPDRGEAQYAKVADLLKKGNRIPLVELPEPTGYVESHGSPRQSGRAAL